MLPETLTLFQTQVCDFSQPYFRPDQTFDTLFHTCLSYNQFPPLGQTNVKGNVYIVQSFELKIPHYKAGCIMRHHKYRIRFYLPN